MKKLIAAVLTALALAGCATGIPVDYSKMTPDAIAALVKDKSISAACGVVNSVYGRVITTSMIVDKNTLTNGTISVDSECKVTIQNAPKAP